MNKKLVLDYFPSNVSRFNKTMDFLAEVIELLQKNGIDPIVYGSLAMFVYTKNPVMNINDVDLLISEKFFVEVEKLLKKNEYKYKYIKKWHMIQVFREGLKIELDSIEYWHNKLLLDCEMVYWKNHNIKVLSLDGLIDVYSRAKKLVDDKSVLYRNKYDSLVRFKMRISKIKNQFFGIDRK